MLLFGSTGHRFCRQQPDMVMHLGEVLRILTACGLSQSLSERGWRWALTEAYPCDSLHMLEAHYLVLHCNICQLIHASPNKVPTKDYLHPCMAMCVWRERQVDAHRLVSRTPQNTNRVSSVIWTVAKPVSYDHECHTLLRTRAN